MDGEYLIISCPYCGYKEAFVYKDAIQRAIENHNDSVFFQCNRLEKCGARGKIRIDLLDYKGAEKGEETPKKQRISEKGIQRINDLYQIRDWGLCTESQVRRKIDILEKKVTVMRGGEWDLSIPDFEKIRGISKETFLEADSCFWLLGFGFLVGSSNCESEAFLQKILASYDRDLIFPIIDADGKVGRVLLRSSKKEMKPKEMQLKLKPGNCNEIWNMKDVVDPSKQIIFICEGVFDALSIKEMATQTGLKNVGAVSMPGVAKIVKCLNTVKQVSPNKTYVLAVDNDAAGNKYREIGAEHGRNIGLKIRDFPIRKYKDLNEFLLGNPEGFKTYFVRKIRQFENGEKLGLWF